MTAAPIPQDEAERLAALGEYAILDTLREQDYDDIVRLAAQICGTPIAIVNFVDADRQWGKAMTGVDDTEAAREHSFCAHTILGDEVLVVEDTQADERFHDNPMVLGDPQLRFYAGAPLRTDAGLALGSLCVADRQPRRLTSDQEAALRALARQVLARLEVRRLALALERQNAELRTLDRLKDELVANVSHDFRSPLTAIMGFAELLERAERPEERQEFLAAVLGSAEHLLRLVDDLLFVGQLRSGALELELEDLDLGALAAEVASSFSPEAARTGVTLTVDATPVPSVRADPVRMRQLLTNLISNAVKFTPAGGSVAVDVDAGDGSVVLAVRDTGVGIPEQDLSRLFDRFFRADVATNGPIGGIGLGLSIVKGVADAHGAAIDVTSAPGAGTSVVVELPLG
jgi:signal transduction histidine kinase